jgi:hypothetical protein
MTPAMISAAETVMLAIISGSAYSDVPVFMSGQDVPDKVPLYIRFWIVASDESIPVGMGITAKSRNVGFLQADVYGRKGKGAGKTGDIGEFIRKEFFRLSIEVSGEGWVVCKDATVKDMGVIGEEQRQMVKVPYRFDFDQV